ncbi:hypothetical protein [Roseibium sp. TrichSKD4]|uniref:hypothetical protein n=1 Tax=Roseibium sp. TrichSKD4 TaxID=744980 RepID=UPI00058F8DB7|nr:hypothetical protein [Roseibium sp. TrichSKD4]
MKNTSKRPRTGFRTGTLLRLVSAALLIATLTAAFDLPVSQRILLAGLCSGFLMMLIYTLGLAQQLTEDLRTLAKPFAQPLRGAA